MNENANESRVGAKSGAELEHQYEAIEEEMRMAAVGSATSREQALDLWRRLLEAYALLELGRASEIAETRDPDPEKIIECAALCGLQALPLLIAIADRARSRPVLRAALSSVVIVVSQTSFLGDTWTIPWGGTHGLIGPVADKDSKPMTHLPQPDMDFRLSSDIAERMLDARTTDGQSPEFRDFPWPGAPEAAIRRKGDIAAQQRELALEIEEIIASLAYQAANHGQDRLQLSDGERLSPDLSLEVVLELGFNPNDASPILERLHSELLAFAKGNVLQGEWGRLEVENDCLFVRFKPRVPAEIKTPRQRKATWV